jgi:hypothetical protein
MEPVSTRAAWLFVFACSCAGSTVSSGDASPSSDAVTDSAVDAISDDGADETATLDAADGASVEIGDATPVCSPVFVTQDNTCPASGPRTLNCYLASCCNDAECNGGCVDGQCMCGSIVGGCGPVGSNVCCVQPDGGQSCANALLCVPEH